MDEELQPPVVEAPQEAPASSIPPTRFVTMTDEEKEQFKLEQKNKNTLRKTKYDMSILEQFLLFQKENRCPTEIPPADLNTILEDFFFL